MTRGFSPRMVQKAPSAVSSRTTDHASGRVSASRRASARLFSSTATSRTASTWRGDHRSSPTRSAKSQAHSSWALRAAVVLAGLDELQPAELAHRLQHPVAHRAARVEHGEQRLVDERAHVVERVVTEHGIRPVEREAVVEGRQPAQRPTLGVVQQVPRPVDDGEQRLVPVGRGAVAAAQQGEPVVEAAVDVLDRHRAHPGRRELDGQRQPVEPAHHAQHGLRVEGHRGPRGPGALAEQHGCRVVVELGEREDPLGGDLRAGPGWW